MHLSFFGSKPTSTEEARALDRLHRTIGSRVPSTKGTGSAPVAVGSSTDLVELGQRLRSRARGTVVPAPASIEPVPPVATVDETPAPQESSRGRWILPAAAALSFAATLCCCGGSLTAAFVSKDGFSQEEPVSHPIPFRPRKKQASRSESTSTAQPAPAPSPVPKPTAPSEKPSKAEPSDGTITAVTDSNFADTLKAHEFVFVDFYATWCGPCQMEEPMITQVAQEYAGQVKVVRIDVDANPVTAENFGVDAYPTFIEYKDGEEVNRVVGMLDVAGLRAEFAALLKK